MSSVLGVVDLRILITFTFELPGVGGVPTHLDLLREEYERLGHEVHFLAPNPTWTAYHLLPFGKSVRKKTLESQIDNHIRDLYRKDHPSIPRVLLDIEVRRHGLMRAAEHFGIGQYDVIHAHDAFSALAMAELTTKGRKVPLVTTLHGCIGAEVLRFHMTGTARDRYVWSYGYGVDHYAATCSDAVIVPAHWVKRELVHSLDAPSERIQVVPHGLKAQKFLDASNQKSEQPWPKDKPIILSHQRLDPFKGHKYMLNALACIHPRRHPYRAYIAGDGGMKEALQQFTKKLRLGDRVTFLGKRRDVPVLLAQSDIVVLPSIVEGFSYSALEAQLAGKPVVGFRTTGIEESVVDGETGLLAPLGDYKALARNIQLLLSDEPLRRRMGDSARERALREFDYKRMAAQTLEIYQKAIAGTGAEVPHRMITAAIGKPDIKRKLKDLYHLYNWQVNIPPVKRGTYVRTALKKSIRSVAFMSITDKPVVLTVNKRTNRVVRVVAEPGTPDIPVGLFVREAITRLLMAGYTQAAGFDGNVYGVLGFIEVTEND